MISIINFILPIPKSPHPLFVHLAGFAPLREGLRRCIQNEVDAGGVEFPEVPLHEVGRFIVRLRVVIHDFAGISNGEIDGASIGIRGTRAVK